MEELFAAESEQQQQQQPRSVSAMTKPSEETGGESQLGQFAFRQRQPEQVGNRTLDSNNGEWIMLNVGGKIFTTTRTTLCTNEPNSMLARMFGQRTNHLRHKDSLNNNNHSDDDDKDPTNETKANEQHHHCHHYITASIHQPTTTISLRPSPRDAQGAYLIDRSPEYFEPILNYLRHGKLIINHNVNVQGVLEEAKFYGIVSLLPLLEMETERWFKKRHQELIKSQLITYDNHQTSGASMGPNEMDYLSGGADGTQLQTMPPLTRLDVIKAIMSTSAQTRELRFQGCNLAGANLSKLDLSNINFKYANLRGTNLKGANLSQASLERADLYQSNLEGAQLIGTNFSHANLENSNLRATTVVDPKRNGTGPEGQPKASFEAANLKNTNFEGSRLVEANLRVAILKGSNLQNCDLTGANLTGADLENCDLSGSDLSEANLRKANIKGAQFELEVL